MPSFNQVTLIGNLTRDPELRYTAKGMAVARLSLAVNRRWKNEAGEDMEEVTFVECDSWGRQAETLCKYMKKGMPLFVSGRLKLDTWIDKKTGEKKARLGVVIEHFQFLGGGDKRPASAPAPPPDSAAAANPSPGADGPPPDDDVPF